MSHYSNSLQVEVVVGLWPLEERPTVTLRKVGPDLCQVGDDNECIAVCTVDTTEGRLVLLALQLQSDEIGLEVYSAAVKAELAKAGW